MKPSIKIFFVLTILLVISAVALVVFNVQSVTTPIHFTDEKDAREQKVIEALVNIRKAELEYKNQKGQYTESFDTLVAFIKNGKMKQVKKEGTLTDEQLEKGLTAAKALAIVKKGNAKEIAEWGLQGFSRDTAYVDVLPALFEGIYDANTINNIRYIPFSDKVDGKKKEFELRTGVQEKNGIKLPLFEAKASYESYLGDLDHQELVNLKEIQEELGRYAGLMVGNADEPNNNAGNWEI